MENQNKTNGSTNVCACGETCTGACASKGMGMHRHKMILFPLAILLLGIILGALIGGAAMAHRVGNSRGGMMGDYEQSGRSGRGGMMGGYRGQNNYENSYAPVQNGAPQVNRAQGGVVITAPAATTTIK